ncbi:MAG: dihydroorotate dehydrogenase (quinone) [Flavobacteriales bacterium]|nr:dihydroorotate dehydrogenase (quinone) [Flavobacteriales bacterium]|tara:strand:+ start:339 stop:1361 length:1023 start_codon:yes stop_codon:yes gene_type:complete
MYKVVRFFLFLFDPEKIHHFTFSLLKIGYPFKAWIWRKIFTIKDKRLEREVFGIKFPNPVGLAAGFDKDAELIDELSCFGFGFIEIGTLTPKAQKGNPKPRLFRLKDDSGIINRMGFNNKGVEDAVTRLQKKKSDIIVGGNIGKNKITPNENATEDYIISFNSLFPYVDYFVVNVSSPNTPGLRDLQDKEPLTNLLNSLQEINNKKENRKPILLKIAPDLTNNQLSDIVKIVFDTKIDGVIATNTTIDRSSLKTNKNKVESIGNGGLSGKPVKERSTEVISYLSEKSNKKIPIIGVGGINSEEDALEKLDAGASLVQIYTGFIYEGPSLVKRINKSLLKR